MTAWEQHYEMFENMKIISQSFVNECIKSYQIDYHDKKKILKLCIVVILTYEFFQYQPYLNSVNTHVILYIKCLCKNIQ